MKFAERLHYDPHTGVITWKDGKRVGLEAGSIHHLGYKNLKFEGTLYLNHRVAWYIHYGCWPTLDIDHINGVKTDNRISNLREATRFENQANRKCSSNNTSGIKGVVWSKASQKWQAQIRHKNKLHYLGQFHDIEEAAATYAQRAKELFGDFMRTA